MRSPRAPYKIYAPWTLDKILLKATPDGDCLRWHNRDTYGNVKYEGKSWKAHRLSYFLSTGENITGMHVHHKCAHKWCVKPEHLQLATQADNALEMHARTSYLERINQLEERVTELEALVMELQTERGLRVA